MAEIDVRDRDYDRNYVRSGASSWSWLPLLLLPVFFFLGWVANDYVANPADNRPEAGVGGAPFEQPSRTPTVEERITPTSEETLTPSPTAEDEDVQVPVTQAPDSEEL